MKIFRLTVVGRLSFAIALLVLLPASLMTVHLYRWDRNAAIETEMRRIHTYSGEVAVEIVKTVCHCTQNLLYCMVAAACCTTREILERIAHGSPAARNYPATRRFAAHLQAR